MTNASTKGQLVVFEGPDAVGKTTLVSAVARALAEHGIAHEVHAFPGNTQGTLGDLVYRLHHDAAASGIRTIAPAALQALHIAAHLDAIERLLLPALEAGKVVLLDRFWWSTWVYGLEGGVEREVLEAMIAVERRAWGGWTPHALVLPDRRSPGETSARLRAEYQALADRYATSHPVIALDTNRPSGDSVAELMSRLPALWANLPVRAASARTRSQGPKSSSGAKGPVSSFSSAKPTVVYDSYWRLAAERQEIFLRRLRGDTPPWTEDSVLLAYKFTNTYRASDRVSQYLLRNVIYGEAYDDRDVFLRIMLFKLFNRIDTWEYLVTEFGDVSFQTFQFQAYDRALEAARARGKKIYSAAYIMPSAGRVFDVPRKHQGHLLLLERMVRDELWKKLQDAGSMGAAFDLLRGYPSIGGFLAYQYLIDLNYSPLLDFSENDFVMPGPGAVDGISKCFSDLGGLSEAEIIQAVCDRQVEEFTRLGVDFKSLWGRPLHLIDCQNLFCEVSKYSRVRHPEIEGIAGRTRIKQIFTSSGDLISPTYPPKWGLNDTVTAWVTANRRDRPTLFPHGGMRRPLAREEEAK
ncbi:MAG: nucleotide kinase domain-containing protein [Myxococcota bacterium]